jgi:hypothetical protein
MMKKEWLILLLLAMTLILVRAPFLNVPLERDEGEYASFAWQMERGVMPYRDVITYISPGVFFLYHTASELFGYTIKGIRSFTVLYLLLTLGLFYYLARKLLGWQWAWLAGVIFIFLSTNPGTLSNMSQREIFALLPLMISFILLQKDLSGNRWYFAAGNGLVITLVCMIKPTAMVQLLFVLAVWTWRYVQNKDHKLFWQKILWLAAGLALGLSLFILYFSIQQALPDFLYWNFIFPRIQSQAIAAFYPTINHILYSLIFQVKYIYQNVFISQFPLGIVLLISLIITVYKRQKALALYWLWFLFLLLSTAAGWHFRRQYFQLLIVPQALLTAWGIQYLYRLLAGKNRLASNSCKVLAAVLILYPFATMAKQYYFLSPNMISRKLYGPQMFSIALPIGDYLASQTAPSDKIYILGSEPEIYFYSQRFLVGRHITAYTLTYAYGDPVARQREVALALKQELPRYILKINQESSLYDYPAVHKENVIFNEVYDLVQAKYILAGFGFISYDKELLVFGRQQVETYLPSARTLSEELDILYKSFGNYYPAVLIFQLKGPASGAGKETGVK